MKCINAPSKTTKPTQVNNTADCIKVDNAITYDSTLPKTAINLYLILASLAGDGNKACVKIKTLAAMLGRAPSTVRVHLNTLVNRGFIERVLRGSGENGNLPSVFIIHDRIRDNLEAQ